MPRSHVRPLNGKVISGKKAMENTKKKKKRKYITKSIKTAA